MHFPVPSNTSADFIDTQVWGLENTIISWRILHFWPPTPHPPLKSPDSAPGFWTCLTSHLSCAPTCSADPYSVTTQSMLCSPISICIVMALTWHPRGKRKTVQLVECTRVNPMPRVPGNILCLFQALHLYLQQAILPSLVWESPLPLFVSSPTGKPLTAPAFVSCMQANIAGSLDSVLIITPLTRHCNYIPPNIWGNGTKTYLITWLLLVRYL